MAMKTEYNSHIILQSVESDEYVLNYEWKSINWKSIGYNIFKYKNGYLKQRKQVTTEKLTDYVGC